MSPARLAVRPGDEVSAQLTVTNTGRVVDSFELAVLGPASTWSRCEPPTVSVFPGQAATARVVFAPPLAADIPAGPMAFGVHVRSHEDPPGSVVEEGALDIAPQPLLNAEMSPRTGRARGRRRAKHQVAIDNTGNTAVVVSVVGCDDQEAVEVVADPSQLDVAPGTAAFVTVRSRGARRFWRGPSQTRPFTVEAQTQCVEPVRMQGTLLHEAAIPGWLPKALMALAAVLVALAVLWFGLFKPSIKDTATNAANRALVAAGVPTGGSSGSGSGSGGGGKSGSPTATPSATPTTTTPLAIGTSAPFSLQLTQKTPNLTPVAKHQIKVTDIVFQNSALPADVGNVVVTRGDDTLITLRLEYFRDYDLHLITPIVLAQGSTMSFKVSCQDPKPQQCSTSAFVSGTTEPVS